MGELILGDALDMLRMFPDNTVDSVCVDPPAGISFMNRGWDNDKGGRDHWIKWLETIMKEALRVTKPGGYALVWALPRTQHWTAMALENAGWNIRDNIYHIFGCLSEDTEILTSNGWKFHHQLEKHDKPYTCNIDTDAYQFDDILDYMEYEYDETAYSIKSDKTNQLVSKHHRCIVVREENNACFEYAEKLAKKELVPILNGCSILEYSLATITPIHYKGVMWCVTVPSGAFIARRNGQVFITGNSGFPKSMDISKQIDKMQGVERDAIGLSTNTRPAHKKGGKAFDKAIGSEEHVDIMLTVPTSELAKQHTGKGTNLKPAVENWILCQKPIEAGKTIAANVIKYGTGGLNIDDSRISYKNDKDATPENGRWPSHLLLTHSPSCTKIGTKKVKITGNGPINKKQENKTKNTFGKYKEGATHQSFKDENGLEEVEDYICDTNCPIRLMDEQSGVLKSGSGVKAKANHNIGFLKGEDSYKFNHDGEYCQGSIGGASRYFQNFGNDSNNNSTDNGSDEPTETNYEDSITPFIYAAKASKRERNLGCDELENKNNHPTLKNQKLMCYLVKLITPEYGTVLDCFMGSGSTIVAAITEGYDYIGIEKDEDYYKIAMSRVNHALQQQQKKKAV